MIAEIVGSSTDEQISASIQTAIDADFGKTVHENWQTDWRTDCIQDTVLEKYALELDTLAALDGYVARPAKMDLAYIVHFRKVFRRYQIDFSKANAAVEVQENPAPENA